VHDFSLSPPVDVEEYAGPMLNGKPIHDGTCEDGGYGCRRCNVAARGLTDEQLTTINWPLTGHCDFCHKEVSTRDICGHMDHEDHCYNEICKECKGRYTAAVAKEREMDRERYED